MAQVIQTAFSAGEVSPDLFGRVDLEWYQLGLEACHNCIIRPHGGASNRAGTKFVGEVYDSTKKTRVIPFQFNTLQTYALEFSDFKMRVIMDGGIVEDPATHLIVSFTTLYGENDIFDLKFVQSADTMFIVHPSYPPQKLTRTAHYIWTFTAATFAPSITAPTGLAGVASDVTTTAGYTTIDYGYVVTAVASNGEESVASSAISVTCHDMEDPAINAKVTLSWTAVAGAAHYNVYKDPYVSGFYGFLGTANNVGFVDKNLGPDMNNAPALTARTVFASAGNYPSTVTFHAERIVYAGSTNEPQTIYMSQVGNYANFEVSSPAKDSDAVTFTVVARQVNAIEHMVSQNNMIMLTTGAEWLVTGSNSGDPITPSSIKLSPQTYWGSHSVQPLIIGNVIIYVQQQGRKVRALGYDFALDGYKGSDMTVRAPHLFRGKTIVDMAYSQEPDSIIWCVMSDGTLNGFTYIQEQNVWAWHQHDTSGTYESVAVIAEGGYDVAYFVVARTINGVAKRYIERMDTRSYTAVEDAFFVDCGLTYSGASATTISGLTHLEGETVSVFADGNVQTQKVVTSGAITLDRAAIKVQIGIPYQSYIKPLRLSLRAEAAGQAKRKRVPDVTIRVQDTRGIRVGETLTSLYDIKTLVPLTSGAPIDLFTGDLEQVTFPSSWADAGQFYIAQDNPLPMTVLAIMPTLAVGQ